MNYISSWERAGEISLTKKNWVNFEDAKAKQKKLTEPAFFFFY